MIPVRGDPVLPSKNATRQPCSSQQASSEALLAASDARALTNARLMRMVLHAFLAASLRSVIGHNSIASMEGLFGLLAGSSASVRLALCCEALEVVRSAFRDLLSTQLAERYGGRFAQEMIGQLNGGAEKFAGNSVVSSSWCASSIMLRSARRSVRFRLAIGS